MIRVENIKKYFPIKDGFFNNKSGDVKAVENVSFEIPEGEKKASYKREMLSKLRSDNPIVPIKPPPP